jgi:hypothetical protein
MFIYIEANALIDKLKWHTSGRISLDRKSVHPSTSSGRTDLLLQGFDEGLYPFYFT